MDYEMAILAGRLSLLLAVFAPGYYLLRTAFVHLQRGGLGSAAQRLRQPVVYARLSHPYIASLLAVTAPYHVYVMWQVHPLSLKTSLGMTTAAAVLLMLTTGGLLKANPADIARRRIHRYGFFLLAALLAAHRLT